MMVDEEQPAWLGNSKSPGSQSPVKNGASNDAQMTEITGTESSGPKYKSFVKVIFLVINLGLMVMMAATGALGIISSSSISDTSTVLVGLYMILFAAMLAIFEIIQIYPCSLIDTVYKKNFGFLYGLMGKSGFTVFMAVLSFGLTSSTLTVATGVLVGLWGIFQYLVYMKFPEYFDKKEKFQP